MEIKDFNIHIWRYALRKLDTFPFYLCQNFTDISDLIMQNLCDQDVTTWLDLLLKRNSGYHENLSKRINTSKKRRQLNYILSILISTVIKNDIGVHGALSPYYLSSRENSKYSFKEFSYPTNVKLAILDNDFDFYKLIEKRSSFDEFIVPYNPVPDRIRLTEFQKKQIDDFSRNIILKLVETKLVVLNTDCSFFAIDYFILQNEVIPLEWHFPGRGIGLHYLPFLNDSTNYDSIYCFMDEINLQIKKYYNQEILLVYDDIPSTTFHELDKCFISVLNKNSSLGSITKSIKLDISNNDRSSIPTRLFPTNTKIKYLLYDRIVNEKDILNVKNLLGNWVIIKNIINFPWWMENRLNPEVHFVSIELINRINHLIKTNGSIVIQELISNSLDKYNHCGELRTFYLLVQ